MLMTLIQTKYDTVNPPPGHRIRWILYINRRDAILDLVGKGHDPFVPLFVNHMKKFGKKESG